MKKALTVVVIFLTVWSGCVEEETTTTTTKAILNASICPDIENLSERFACYTGLKSDSFSEDRVDSISAAAVRFADPDLCELIGDYEMSGHGRFYCFTGVACALKDPPICDRYLGYSTFFRPQCITAVACALKDPSICDRYLGDNTYFSSECKERVEKAIGNTTTSTTNMTTTTTTIISIQHQLYECIVHSQDYQNPEECETPREPYIWAQPCCYYKIAEATKNPEICEKIRDIEWRNSCYRVASS